MGFNYEDLYDINKLNLLKENFYEYYSNSDNENYKQFEKYINSDKAGNELDEPAILIDAAKHLSFFLGELFNITEHLKEIELDTVRENLLFSFKKDFIQKNLLKKMKDVEINEKEVSSSINLMNKLKSSCFPELAFNDDEFDSSIMMKTLAEIEKDYRWFHKGDKFAPENFQIPESSKTLGNTVITFAKENEITSNDTPDDEVLDKILSMAERWLWGRYLNESDVKKWTIFFQPKKTDYDYLVEYRTENENGFDKFINHSDHFRERTGFYLNEIERTHRQFLNQIDYCMYCHDRKKDSCSTGFFDRFGELQKNPLGNKLKGCPLDEKISESHLLRKNGFPLASLSVIMIDNPMCPGTGHRICNDCMKGCIYQKQEPVNIPLAESTILREIIGLPYGFEIYSLLTRWNPLIKNSQVEKAYNGKNVLVTGLGPAGYTLAHYLLNEGFGVVGIDGLKIERIFNEYTLRKIDGQKVFPKPVKYFDKEIYNALDERILHGFGGVTEYGITVRWDKNFLTVIYLTLMRRENFAFYDGVTLGNTITIKDAWEMGFKHLSLCTGAAKPTIIRIKNNLLGGIRKSSDFLMQLQLTGAQKDDNLTSLQISLPGIVIGGGLTAIDCATELIAYYPVMVQKIHKRYNQLSDEARAKYLSSLDEYGKKKIELYLSHAEEFIAEKQNADNENREPKFVELVNKFGGVKLIYRKRLNDAPAYRENHEEVIEALEQGVEFVQLMAPSEAIPDEKGNLKAMRFEVQVHNKDEESGRDIFKGTGEFVEFPAGSMVIAAGTSPNTIYNDEHEDTFDINDKTWYFNTYDVEVNNNQAKLNEIESGEGFFTSYIEDNKTVSFFGDCHPNYFGSVVKAMASVKNGYGKIINNLEILESDTETFSDFAEMLDDKFKTVVTEVNELSGKYISLKIISKNAALKWKPGKFFKIQNYETSAIRLNGVTNFIEPVFLSPNKVDTTTGQIEFIIYTKGASTELIRTFKPGDVIYLTGPSGDEIKIPENETVLIAAEGFGNSYMLPVIRAMKERGNKIIYFAGFREMEYSFELDELKEISDEFYPCFKDEISITDSIKNELKTSRVIDRIFVNGSAGLMKFINEQMHGGLSESLGNAKAVGTLNTTLQCMMNGVCGECLQEVKDSEGRNKFVYGCFKNVHELNCINLDMYKTRLSFNEVFEKLNTEYLNTEVKI